MKKVFSPRLQTLVLLYPRVEGSLRLHPRCRTGRGVANTTPTDSHPPYTSGTYGDYPLTGTGRSVTSSSCTWSTPNSFASPTRHSRMPGGTGRCPTRRRVVGTSTGTHDTLYADSGKRRTYYTPLLLRLHAAPLVLDTPPTDLRPLCPYGNSPIPSDSKTGRRD